MNLVSHIEMALPRQSDFKKTYYHGTNEANGLKIIENGLVAPEITEKRMMTPVKGKVYVTSNLTYAIIYALGGDFIGHEWDKKGYGYVFEISGNKLKDIQPDEDSVGELVAKVYRERDKNIKLSWLINLFLNNTTPTQKKKVLDGEYMYWASVGKKLVKLMSDEQKLQLIDAGAHIAHEGNIFPDKAYKIDISKSSQLKRDGSNFFSLAEKIIYTKKQNRHVS